MTNQPPRAPQSIESIVSFGIGDNLAALQQQKESGLPHLLPEGAAGSNDPVYDCIVYLIYCPEHDRIAVTSFEKVRCTWLPFVILPEGVTWQKASHDGVAILIGRQDAEMDAEEAEKTAPIYTMSYLHMLRIQLPSSKMILRLTQFVHLQKNEFFQCCQNNNRVNWIPSSDIMANKIPKVWGPELRILTSMLVSAQPHIISEFTLNNTLYYLYLNQSPEQKVLQQAKMTDTHIYEVYEEYVEHCYPSFYMCFESFRAYFIKNGHDSDDIKLTHLFNAFSVHRRSFIDFHEFLIGVLIIEPNCPNNLEARVHFIFRYYDFEQKGSLNTNNILIMLREMHPTLNDNQLTTLLRSVLHEKFNTDLTFVDFQVLVQDDLANNLYGVVRMPKSILKQIAQSKTDDKYRFNAANDAFLKAKRATKGTCLGCRTQQYTYANHCVTIDTVGRCVEPKIISKPWLSKSDCESKTMNRTRYSLEYVFTISSVPNIFIDLVRDFYHKKDGNVTGLMAVQEDWGTFTKYLRILCQELSGILLNEFKLIKINAPAIVIGDVQGNLHDLLQLERLFFQSFPVISENLVFLGNYSGDHPFGVECLIYLFSLKLCSPNKVFLLRGAHELSNRNVKFLKGECSKKYGPSYGKIIYGIFTEIFAKLPIAVLIDEHILCVHSGIPNTTRLDRLYKLGKELHSVEDEAPIAHEILTRYPRRAATQNSTSTMKSSDNVCKYIYGSKSGDSEYHLNFKSVKKSGSKGTKSLQCVKMRKSLTKSGSLQKKSNRSISSRSKSLETIKSGKSLQIKSSDSLVTKSNKSLGKLTKSNSSLPKLQFRFKSIKANKLKPIFLKSTKLNKSCQLKQKSNSLSKHFPDRKSKGNHLSINRHSNTFDIQEFVDYLKVNDLSFMIRSHSVCANGYKINFDGKCLTIFSCSNFRKLNNQAAVALVDGSNFTIRFVRYDTSCVK